MSTGQLSDPEVVAERRRRLGIRVVAIVLALLGLVGFAFMLFLGRLMSFGLYSWTEPQLDPDVWIPVLGGGVVLMPAPLVMSLGDHRRRWLIAAAAAFGVGAFAISAATWIAVLLD